MKTAHFGKDNYSKQEDERIKDAEKIDLWFKCKKQSGSNPHPAIKIELLINKMGQII